MNEWGMIKFDKMTVWKLNIFPLSDSYEWQKLVLDDQPMA